MSSSASYFVSGPHRKKLQAMLKQRSILAAVAYVSCTDGLSLTEGDVLVCNASEKSALAGATRRDTLKRLVRKGVKVWSNANLHAKVVIAEDMVLVGSANWSVNSEANLLEASIFSEDQKVVAAAKAYVNGLIRDGGTEVNREFLKNMPEPMAAVEGGGGNRRAQKTRKKERCWLINLHPLKVTQRNRAALEGIDKMAKNLQENVPDSVESVLYSASSKIALKIDIDDKLVIIWRASKIETLVYPECVVCGIYQKDGYRGILYQSSKLIENRGVPWSSFSRIAMKAGITRISTGSERELTAAQASALASSWTLRTC